MGSDSNNPPPDSGSSSSDDLSEYLQVFLDETAEELDSLVESILQLEGDPRNSDSLNKAFRMLHSLKGSCGMMGFEVVGNFAHLLEDRFEKYRSGQELLNRDTATLVLQCVDYFREFIDRLRSGDTSEGDPSGLALQLSQLSDNETSGNASVVVSAGGSAPPASSSDTTKPVSAKPASPAVTMSGGIRIKVKFKPRLQLADLKARLIVSRLSSIGEVVACDPNIEDVRSFDELPLFSLTLLTDRKLEEIRKIASVDGVESIELEGGPLSTELKLPLSAGASSGTTAIPAEPAKAISPLPVQPLAPVVASAPVPAVKQEGAATTASLPAAAPVSSEAVEGKNPVNETLRIDIERLDRLMNLTGELVVTNARFAQITSQMSPVFRRNSVFNKSKDLTERLRQRLEYVRQQIGVAGSSDERWSTVFNGLQDELEGLDEQSALWDEGHRHFLQITEAVDQLTRVSKNLQRGVLNTRMVPVGPLLNRFKRVIRDLSVERGKRVQLVVQGENTELDRRMIDSLGDPLLHLVRNSIDHGLEPIEQRLAAGKPAIGTISIEASHRGNNVSITVRDDGGGINTDKIRARIVSRGLASESQASELSEQQIIDYIWHPGFSTAEQVTDISGRGVGMDIVHSSITRLSGTIDIASIPGQGTTFTIRLPLTLAIIRSLLIQNQGGHFSIPIDDVREIVSVAPDKIHAVHRHLTIDVRGELISLATMENVFDWNRSSATAADQQGASSRNVNVVLLHARGKTLGLCVDALVGRADIVIKSLSENYVAIRGLSGASIMGDGKVCLMLDCTSLIELASERAASRGASRR